ncbi:hypothetical protein PR202_gb23676 [Eleusine coracana subsp. coracana]|uniref:Uncharacterized protein n=1 Tax=Eleusine coracana subsp. coracana TaxID=191504 RepID=A0AAV5FGU1_ELECO|nr:hypothetical protein QOZ80_5BG0439380 [Eleusine coracana subsp. coracana]GJN34959.1 hypothetical protein PR202_gb23676 [Eleusine coracana subsp. coracana]
MGSAGKIIRAALHAFFRHYHPSSSAASLLALPFSAAALLARSHPALLGPAHLLSRRLRRVLVAAGFPPASQLLFLLSHRLSQRACAFLASLPFSLTFLLLAKACAVHHCCGSSSPPVRPQRQWRRGAPAIAIGEMVRSSFPAMARTELANCLALLLANAAVFAALLAAFNAAAALGLLGPTTTASFSSTSFSTSGDRAVLALSAAGVIVYSVAMANAAAACNLATVVAAVEGGNGGGARAVLKAALMLLRAGDAATAVAASLPVSLAAAAVEALFQLRVARPCAASGGRVTAGMIVEGVLVAYIHAMICVLDTVVSSMVYQRCKASRSCELLELELEGKEDTRV